MGGIDVRGPGSERYEPEQAEEAPGLETTRDPDEPVVVGGRLSVDQKAKLSTAQLERLPVGELAELAERYPEVVARLPLAKLTEIGNKCPAALEAIYHSEAATVPPRVPSGFATGTHVFVPGSGVDLPFLVQAGVNRWKGKSFDPETGMMKDRVSLLPDSKAKAYIGDIDQAIRDAGGTPVNADGRGALITDYTQASQAFGVKLRWIDEFRELPNGTLLGVSYWMDGAEAKKWSYVLLDFEK